VFGRLDSGVVFGHLGLASLFGRLGLASLFGCLSLVLQPPQLRASPSCSADLTNVEAKTPASTSACEV
jgi:hypothetical protein